MNCPLPRYYLCHAIVSLIIAAALWWPLGLNAGLAAGVAFYAGREYTQWESGLPFDWKGITAPLAACLVVFGIYLYAR
jgi:hypothetical protein